MSTIENLTINNSIKARHMGSWRTANQIKYIAIHYTANGGTTATAKGVANYFSRVSRPASAHYTVDEGDVIYQSVDDLRVAYAVGDRGRGTMKDKVLNSNSISIELVSHGLTARPNIGEGKFYIPEKTVLHGMMLTAHLMKKYNIPITNVVRHYDVTGKRCPEPWTVYPEGEKLWKKFKAETLEIYEDGGIEVIKKTKIVLLGKEIEVDGIFKENRNFVPIRFLSKLGFNINVNSKNQPVISTDIIKMNIGGEEKKIRGIKTNGTHYVAIRDIAEALNREVSWDNEKQKISIK